MLLLKSYYKGILFISFLQVTDLDLVLFSTYKVTPVTKREIETTSNEPSHFLLIQHL